MFQFKVCLEAILFHLLERNILGFAQEEEPLLSVSVVEANEEEEILLDRDSERQEGDGGGREGRAAAPGPAHQARARQGLQERSVNEISRNFRSSTGLLRMLCSEFRETSLTALM